MSNNSLSTLSAEDLALMYSSDFTKKKAEQVGRDLVNQLFENGEIDPLKVWSNIVRLKEVVNNADKAFRDRIIINTKEDANGVEFSFKNGSKKLNYEEDLIYLEIKESLSQRAELLKTAHNSKDVIFDSNGIEVPKVGCTYDKSSVVVKF